MKKKYGIGMDIGGTKISMILGTARGRILVRRQIPTLKNEKRSACLKNMVFNLNEMLLETGISQKEVAGIGIGIPGAVDSARGTVPRSPNLQGWAGFPLRRYLAKYFKMPVAMTNDANAAVMGEKIFGAGRRAKHLIYMTVSTGVGGGLVVNGCLVEGANFVGGEVGHMVIQAGGNLCNCGQRGCLEAHASGTAISRFVENEIRRGKGTRLVARLGKKRNIEARAIGDAARAGEPLALEAWRQSGFYLGVGIGSLLNILNPELVILGGGVFKSAPAIHWQSMLKSVRQHAWPDAVRAVKLVRTTLGDDVGNLGALALVFAPQPPLN